MDKNEMDAVGDEAIHTLSDPDSPALKNRVVLLNGFGADEISAIMKAVKGLCQQEGGTGKIAASGRDLIFAMTTPTSIRRVLGEVLIDMSGDHEYLRKNPPKRDPGSGA